MSDAALTQELFRGRAAQELRGREHLAGWLETWGSSEAATRGDTRPWTATGREWAGFAETFGRVLKWYKLDKVRTFRPLGWTLNGDAIARVADALRHVIDEARRDPTCPDATRTWLETYDVGPLARYTAIDERFQTVTGQLIRAVLDFGSGIGRQAFAWSHQRSDVRLYSIDAVESLYLLQSEMYRRLFGARLIEYFSEPAFAAAIAGAADDAVVHLPTWQMGAIPAASVDLAICVQVLQELSEPTVRHVLAELRRIVRPDGLLYIRDMEFWTPAHSIRVGRVLLADGWRLVLRYGGDEGTEIEGVPRLWVNAGDDNSRYFRVLPRLKRAFLPSYARSFRSWRDVGLPI